MTAQGAVTNKSAPNRIELSGQRFGRLIAGEAVLVKGRTQQKLHYMCICDCGKSCLVNAQNLRRGMARSCGCLRAEIRKTASLVHGMSRTSIHNTWSSMMQRCYDQKCKAYPDYGGRGIKVCDSWHDFRNFYADMGEPPQKYLTLDRINNDGGYEPGNVRWATRREQANNRRSNRMLEFDGKCMSATEWERFLGFPKGLVIQRLSNGWTVGRALTQKHRFDVL